MSNDTDARAASTEFQVV